MHKMCLSISEHYCAFGVEKLPSSELLAFIALSEYRLLILSNKFIDIEFLRKNLYERKVAFSEEYLLLYLVQCLITSIWTIWKLYFMMASRTSSSHFSINISKRLRIVSIVCVIIKLDSLRYPAEIFHFWASVSKNESSLISWAIWKGVWAFFCLLVRLHAYWY